MEHFFAYRVFLNQDRTKLQFKPKQEAFKEVLEKLSNNEEIKFYDYGEHLILHLRQYGEHIHLLQLAKKQEFDKPVLDGHKIEEVKDERYPFVYLIFHTQRQIVFIERNTSVFQTLEGVKSKVERVLTEQMNLNSVVATLIEISDNRDFWTQIEDFDIVEKVELEYEPPNFFGGKNAADNLVKDVHEETNFEKFKIFLQNTHTGLKFQYDVFKEHIQRISQGAGNYSIEGVKDGIKQWVKKSLSMPLRTDIPDVNTETEETLEERFRHIENINDEEDR